MTTRPPDAFRSRRRVGAGNTATTGSWELRPHGRWQFTVLVIAIVTSPLGLGPQIGDFFSALAALGRRPLPSMPYLVLPAAWGVHLFLRLRHDPPPRWLRASLVVLIGAVAGWVLLALTMTQDTALAPTGHRLRGGLPIHSPQIARHLTAVSGTVMLANMTFLAVAAWLLLRRQPTVRWQQVSWYAICLGPGTVGLAQLHIVRVRHRLNRLDHVSSPSRS